jgi:REP element-mobilizing transposase RayT
MTDDQSPRGWYSRGYLPHFDAGPSRTQFITCRLYDSLPQGSVLERIKKEMESNGTEDIARQTIILAEKYLDRGYGQCFLRDRSVAEIVRDSIKKFDLVRYLLFAWVIMPNHVHLLLRPLPGFSLAQIAHSFKSYTGLMANRALGREGEFWMREPFDRYMRDSDHFKRTVRYIENNPVKAGLCARPEDWEFSSAWNGNTDIPPA